MSDDFERKKKTVQTYFYKKNPTKLIIQFSYKVLDTILYLKIYYNSENLT